MSEIHNLLPRLTVNRILMLDLLEAESPCFAMGYVEQQQKKRGFIAVRPKKPIPELSSQQGMNFGHSVIGTSKFKVFHFGFEFYDHATYHGLIPAGNPITQAVISTMLETKDYFFFAINPDQSITAFNSLIDDHDLSGLRTNQEKFGNAQCTAEQYEAAVTEFSQNPSPPGTLMTWMCRNNWEYLDLKKHPLDLTPRA